MMKRISYDILLLASYIILSSHSAASSIRSSNYPELLMY